jgi:DNA-binding transcriptional LysR family regulator
VANDRNFTNAAKRLNISRSAISEQVKMVEEGAGFPLFRRRQALSRRKEGFLAALRDALKD